MLANSYYIITHYLFLGLFVCAFWGIGHYLLSNTYKLEINDQTIGAVLAVTLGQGIFIVLLQCLAVAGVLKYYWLLGLLVGAALLAIFQWQSLAQSPLASIKLAWQGLSHAQLLGLVFLFIFALPTLLEPLRPPWPGDELHYHLPHAQQWALSGQLTVNEWLRYPWFPYNYNLLYASAFVVNGDVFTHMLNALAGCLVAILIYRLGLRHFSQAVACVSTFIWFQLYRREFGKTNVDMGVTLYSVAASLLFFWWLQAPKDRRWLLISAFLMGIAVGSKYQALFFLPLFVLAILWNDRRPYTLMVSSVSFLVPCIYWYARNAILTGDPFNPVGGKIFGFTDWNMADYVTQFEAIKQAAVWPSFMLWPALLALFKINKLQLDFRLFIFSLGGYFFLIWMVTSRYPRYLMPVVPFLALLAAEQWCIIYKFIGNRLSLYLSNNKMHLIINILWVAIFIAATLASINFMASNWANISPTPDARHALMLRELKGYAVLEYTNQHQLGRIYNEGMGDAVYYAAHPVWGDVFGHWRYQDIVSDDPVIFSTNLKNRKFDAVIVSQTLGQKLESNSSFNNHFSHEFENNGIRIYRINK